MPRPQSRIRRFLRFTAWVAIAAALASAALDLSHRQASRECRRAAVLAAELRQVRPWMRGRIAPTQWTPALEVTTRRVRTDQPEGGMAALSAPALEYRGLLRESARVLGSPHALWYLSEPSRDYLRALARLRAEAVLPAAPESLAFDAERFCGAGSHGAVPAPPVPERDEVRRVRLATAYFDPHQSPQSLALALSLRRERLQAQLSEVASLDADLRERLQSDLGIHCRVEHALRNLEELREVRDRRCAVDPARAACRLPPQGFMKSDREELRARRVENLRRIGARWPGGLEPLLRCARPESTRMEVARVP